MPSPLRSYLERLGVVKAQLPVGAVSAGAPVVNPAPYDATTAARYGRRWLHAHDRAALEEESRQRDRETALPREQERLDRAQEMHALRAGVQPNFSPTVSGAWAGRAAGDAGATEAVQRFLDHVRGGGRGTVTDFYRKK